MSDQFESEIDSQSQAASHKIEQSNEDHILSSTSSSSSMLVPLESRPSPSQVPVDPSDSQQSIPRPPSANRIQPRPSSAARGARSSSPASVSASASASASRPGSSSVQRRSTSVVPVSVLRNENIAMKERMWKERALQEWLRRRTVLRWRDADRELRIAESRTLKVANEEKRKEGDRKEQSARSDLERSRHEKIKEKERERNQREVERVSEFRAAHESRVEMIAEMMRKREEERLVQASVLNDRKKEERERDLKRERMLEEKERARIERNQQWWKEWKQKEETEKSLADRVREVEGAVDKLYDEKQNDRLGLRRAGAGGRTEDEQMMNVIRMEKIAQRERLRKMREVDRLKKAGVIA
eukprot:ANDGO_07975.mRNA.1 hypothetical protein